MKRILIKMSGELFSTTQGATFNIEHIQRIVSQIAKISLECEVALVVGGGNFFRGEQHGASLGLDASHAHSIGMLATVMNGLILQNLLQRKKVESVVLNSFSCSTIASKASEAAIHQAFEQRKVIIFTGGTGAPFFTTDTAGVVRCLQISADQMWKATKVDGVYDKPPLAGSDARLLKKLTYEQILRDKLRIMDLTAITLAQKHQVTIKVFNLFAPDSLYKALHESDYASIITS